MRISDWSSDVFSSDLGTAVRAAGVSAAGVSVSLIFPDSAAAAQHARARFAGPTGRALNHKPFLPARPLCRAFVLWSQHIDSFPRGDAFVVLERSEEHTSELQSIMRSSYAVFCLKKKNKK